MTSYVATAEYYPLTSMLLNSGAQATAICGHMLIHDLVLILLSKGDLMVATSSATPVEASYTQGAGIMVVKTCYQTGWLLKGRSVLTPFIYTVKKW